jgi:hypothetical protein
VRLRRGTGVGGGTSEHQAPMMLRHPGWVNGSEGFQLAGRFSLARLPSQQKN